MWPRLIALLLIIGTANYSEQLYRVPEPEIVVFKSGLRVIIPEAPGITEFQFHGNVNETIESFSSGAINLEHFTTASGKLVLEEHNTPLKVGDCIHYWMYVTKDGARYVKHNKLFQVTELAEEEFINNEGQNHDTSYAKPQPENTDRVCSCERYLKIEKELERLSNTVKNLEDIVTRVMLALVRAD